MAKLYPFNATKHAHDVEFRYNRVFNTMHDKRMNGEVDDEYEKLDELHTKLQGVLEQCMGGGIVWLEGKDWALANECIGWAATMRGM